LEQSIDTLIPNQNKEEDELDEDDRYGRYAENDETAQH
jgi:hypothetical protein